MGANPLVAVIGGVLFFLGLMAVFTAPRFQREEVLRQADYGLMLAMLALGLLIGWAVS